MTPQPSLLPAEIDALEQLATANNRGLHNLWTYSAADVLLDELTPAKLVALCAAARSASSKEAEMARDAAHGVRFATVRDAGDDQDWDIECRFTNGEKYAAIQVDRDKPELADWIAAALSADRENPVAQDDGKETK